MALVRKAYDDLERRTLSGMPGDFARLIYLASTRDYNSGMYHHEGLAARYGIEQAREALQTAQQPAAQSGPFRFAFFVDFGQPEHALNFVF